MEILSPCKVVEHDFAEKWKHYQTLDRQWVEVLCHPPYRADIEASAAWSTVMPFLLRQPPLASCLDFEKAWSKDSQRKSLALGLRALSDTFGVLVESWLRQAPLRFLKVARVLGSLAPERRETALANSARHPFFAPDLHLPSSNLGEACLQTWSPLPPPSRVAEAVGRQLSTQEEAELRQSIENWIPIVQLEILRHHCGAKAWRKAQSQAPRHREN